MKRPELFLLVLASSPLGSPLAGADKTVKMFDGVFLPSAVTIQVGESVTWEWVEGTHRVVSGLSSSDPQAGELFDAPVDAAHPRFTYIFRQAGIFAFFDQLHESAGSAGTVSVDPYLSRVEVVDIAFALERHGITAGDAVEWIWIEGDHTITSGNGSSDPRVGDLFDVPSTVAQPYFSFTFPRPGIYIYFCRPHEIMGMFGEIRVRKPFVRGDLSGDGRADISDAVLILFHLFLGEPVRDCPDAGDANDSGQVEVADASFLLAHLFQGGASLPPPYPAEGADRTEDDLECW